MEKILKPEAFEIFGKIFFLSNRLEYLGDNELRKEGLTTKQWQLIAVTGKYFTLPPSVSEVAEVLSTTHQNVKQIALKLQKKGFISIDKDEKDKRVLRIRLTEKNTEYWESKSTDDVAFISSLFYGLSDQEIQKLYELLNKIQNNVDTKYNEVKARY